MKLYASIHGVCGLAEGYSDTTVQFFKTLEQAKEHKARLLALLMKAEHEEVITHTDGTQDIIVYDDLNSEQEILKIVEVNPLYDIDKPDPANSSKREWLMWNQLDTSLQSITSLPLYGFRNTEHQMFLLDNEH